MAMQAPTKTSSAHRSTFLQGTHRFDIIGYSKRKALGGSNTVRSGDFEAGGRTWALVCCFGVIPGDSNPHQCQLASIFLKLVSSNDYVIAKASLWIDDPAPPSSGRRRWPPALWRSAEAHAFPATAAGSVDDVDVSGASSWKLSIPDTFRESLYVKDDRLTIHCTVDVLLQEKVGTSATRNCFVSVVPPPSISRDLRKLLHLDESKPNSGMPFMTDVTFVVEQTEIQAHRLVLAMRSPVFAAELLGGMKESATCTRITIDDMSASTFKAMLFFIYTDELPLSALKPKNDNVATATTSYVTMVGDLLVAADRYDLERLRLMCEKILSENLDAAAAMTALMLVHGRDRCRQLEASCIEYMASDPAAVVATKEYKELKERCGPFVTDVLEKVWMRALALAHNSPSSSSSSSETRSIPEKSASMFNSSELFTGSHEFRIPNFSAVHKMFGVNNECVESGTFQIGGHDMSICVYPSGRDGDGYVDMFLAGAGTTNALVSATFKIDDPSGRSPPQIRWAENFYTGPLAWFGVKKFMDVTTTKLYYLRYDGSLTVRCDVKVSKQCSYTTSTTGAVGAVAIIPPPSNIAYHLERLVLSGQCFDVKFLVQDSEFCAHELVIAARSPILHRAISSAPDKDHVKIDDIGVQAFRAVLHFIYTDELPVIMMARDAVTVVARDLLVAADRFGLERMKAMCENMICEQVTTQNVMGMLELADRRRFQGLKDFCLDHIAQPHVLKEAMETDGFKGLKATSPWLLEEILVKISKLSSADL